MITPPRDATPKEATGVIRMHPGTGWIVVPGDNGVLQFYDPLRDKHVKFLRVRHLRSIPICISRNCYL